VLPLLDFKDSDPSSSPSVAINDDSNSGRSADRDGGGFDDQATTTASALSRVFGMLREASKDGQPLGEEGRSSSSSHDDNALLNSVMWASGAVCDEAIRQCVMANEKARIARDGQWLSKTGLGRRTAAALHVWYDENMCNGVVHRGHAANVISLHQNISVFHQSRHHNVYSLNHKAHKLFLSFALRVHFFRSLTLSAHDHEHLPPLPASTAPHVLLSSVVRTLVDRCAKPDPSVPINASPQSSRPSTANSVASTTGSVLDAFASSSHASAASNDHESTAHQQKTAPSFPMANMFGRGGDRPTNSAGFPPVSASMPPTPKISPWSLATPIATPPTTVCMHLIECCDVRSIS